MQSAKIQRVAANTLLSPADRRPSLSIVTEKQAVPRAPARPKILDPRSRKRPKLLQVSRDIDVFDGGGRLVRTYSVVLGANCLVEEYEDYALAMAELDGLAGVDGLCRACCDRF